MGAILGVSIGDVFLFRMELCVVGQAQSGIYYVPMKASLYQVVMKMTRISFKITINLLVVVGND